MKVLFLMCPVVTFSDTTRCLSIADALSPETDSWAAVCTRSRRKWFESLGIPTFKCVDPTYRGVKDGKDMTMPTVIDFIRVFGLADEDFLKDTIHAEVDAIRNFKPDVIYSNFSLTAPISAKICGVPIVSTARYPYLMNENSLTELIADTTIAEECTLYLKHRESLPKVSTDGINAILREYRLDPIERITDLYFLQSTLKIAPTIPELEPQLKNIPDLHYVGYLVSESFETSAAAEWLSDMDSSNMIIYVYFSRGSIMPQESIDVLPKALDGTEIQAIVSFGYHPAVPNLPPSTKNVRFEFFVPGMKVLEKSKGILSHGGQNLLVNGLLHGVPGIMVPCSDFVRQFDARSVNTLGIGLSLKRSEFIPETVRETIYKILNPEFSERARACGEKVRALGGPKRAVELMRSLV